MCPPSWNTKAPHLKLICDHLDAAKRGEIDRLAIFLPPRHGKTETVTVRFPVYLLDLDPTERCLVTGYNERFARRFSRKSRNVAHGLIEIASDKAGADEWETTAGGGVVARGVGTPPMGFGFDWIFIDDPIKKREEAESEVYREKMWDWYTDDLMTRLEPGGRIVMCLTRWHHDDLAARAIASEPEKWVVLRLPALAEEDDPLGRQVGESLWPDRFNEKALQRTQAVMMRDEGAYSFESLYQQNPTPREGAFFKVTQFKDKFIARAEVPKDVRLCRAWDLAATGGAGDYTVGALLGVDNDGKWYVLNIVRGQYKPDERNDLVKLTAQTDGSDVLIRLTQDPGQAGVDQLIYLTRMLAGFQVRPERATGSKETRAGSFASQVNGGNVWLAKDDWNQAFIEELRQFPNGKHDDQVDAASDAFNDLANRNTGLIWGWS